MSRLMDAQSALTDYVFHAPGQGPPVDTGMFQALPGADQQQRLDAYRRNTLGAQRQALEPVFPVIQQLLGEPSFQGIARRYAQTHPSLQPDLNQYGKDFCVFLQTQVLHLPEFSELPYLADLASLEWMLHRAYYLPDDPDFDFDGFAARAAQPQRLVFTLSASLGLLHSDWPVLEIWRAHQHSGEPAPVADLHTGQSIICWRDELRPRLETLAQEMYVLLSQVQQGLSLAALAERNPGLPRLLPEALQQGWIRGYQECLSHV